MNLREWGMYLPAALLSLLVLLCEAADIDTTTVERLQVEVRHEMYTVVDTVQSTTHLESGNQVFVRLKDGRGIKYNRVEEIKCLED